MVKQERKGVGTLLICDFFLVFPFRWALHFPRVALYSVWREPVIKRASFPDLLSAKGMIHHSVSLEQLSKYSHEALNHQANTRPSASVYIQTEITLLQCLSLPTSRPLAKAPTFKHGWKQKGGKPEKPYNPTIQRKIYFLFFAVKKHIFILIYLLFSSSCRSGARGSSVCSSRDWSGGSGSEIALPNLLDTGRSICVPIVFAKYPPSRTSWIWVLIILSKSAGETLGAKLSVFIKNFPIATEAWVLPAPSADVSISSHFYPKGGKHTMTLATYSLTLSNIFRTSSSPFSSTWMTPKADDI